MIFVIYQFQWWKGKGKYMGGMKRERELNEDDPYDLWITSLDIMEMGADQLLRSAKMQRKAVVLMAERHAKMESESE